jgi:hypothetical protein
MMPRLICFAKKWHGRLREVGSFLSVEMTDHFNRLTRDVFVVKPSIVDGYPNFSSIPRIHKNRRFLTAWLSLCPEKFDQIPERLVTTEMRYVFCEADASRLKRFETLPYEDFEALAIMLYEKGSNTQTMNPAALQESFLLKLSKYATFDFVSRQTQFQEHLFTQRVISRVVRDRVFSAYHLHSGLTANDDECRERIKALILDEDLIYHFGIPSLEGDFSSNGKKHFHPNDVKSLRAMGKLHLVDDLVGIDHWSFDLEMPTSLDHCFWLMSQPTCDLNCSAIYQAWLRKFPIEDVLSMAGKKSSWHSLAIPVFDTSLLTPFFKQYPWLKGHVLEDMLGL